VRRAVGAALLLAHVLAAAPAAARADLPSLLSALELGGYRPDKRPPAFSGRTLDGATMTLRELHGRVVLVTFWASWCEPCRTELPVFETLHREIGAEGLAVVAINARERVPTIREFWRSLDLTFAVVLDPRGEIQRTYGVLGLPTTFLIARDGRAVARAIGPRDWATPRFRELVLALLREPATPAASPRTGK
jgi:thiol-disulfide isomerase/thioredoxin